MSSKSLAGAPVFGKTLSFGGNGNRTAGRGPGNGHCVLDGSFSDLPLRVVDNPEGGSIYMKHCLSRGFAVDDPDGHEAGLKVDIAVIREIIDQPDYVSFFEKLRAGPMNAIPEWIGGEFSQVTGPNDPLFILHLVQLDRLWWLWQMIDPFNRNQEYAGLAFSDSQDAADLQDELTLGTYLHPNVVVYDVMATNYGGVLCYNYTVS